MPRSLRYTFMLLACLAAVACGKRDVTYGVVLWNPGRLPFDGGTIVRYEAPPVESRRITVHDLDGGKSGTLPQGLIKSFPSLQQAKQFRDRTENYRDMLARATVQAVRIRKKPSADAEVVYRLRDSEQVKVVQQAGAAVTLGGRRGHWYEVVTRSGTAGFAFGPLLRFPNEAADSMPGQSLSSEAVTTIEEFLSTTWRPAYMQHMLAAERINLKRFDPNIGLFPEEERILLNTGKSRIEFPGSRPERIGDSTYLFAGGDLQVKLEADNEVIIRYERHGTSVRERYVKLGVDMRQIIEEERRRRERVYRSLREIGTLYRSEHYGTLELLPDRTARWTERERLEPQPLPADAEAEARVRMNVFLGQAMSRRYDGALTLLFDLGPRNKELAFAYELSDAGLRLTLVPVEHVRDDVIQSLPGSPTVMYFSAGNRSGSAGDSSSSG